MLLTAISLFFVFMAIKGALHPMGPKRFDSYFFMMLLVALIVFAIPLRQYLYEEKLASAAGKLINNQFVGVTCLSRLGGFWHWNAAGFVKRGGTEIYLQQRTCNRLRNYLSDPAEANQRSVRDYRDVYGLHVLTHEAMHVAGIYNEQEADCAAFQRNHRMGELLGVPRHVSGQSAIVLHRFRPKTKGYYSDSCEPGRAMDEKLADAVWRAPD